MFKRSVASGDAVHEDCWKDLYRMRWTEGEREEERVREEEGGREGERGGEGAPGLAVPESFPAMFAATGVPDFTNYARGFVETLDYVFANKDFFKAVRTAPNPTREDIKRLVAMPNEEYESDHLPLCADLEIIERRKS